MSETFKQLKANQIIELQEIAEDQATEIAQLREKVEKFRARNVELAERVERYMSFKDRVAVLEAALTIAEGYTVCQHIDKCPDDCDHSIVVEALAGASTMNGKNEKQLAMDLSIVKGVLKMCEDIGVEAAWEQEDILLVRESLSILDKLMGKI